MIPEQRQFVEEMRKLCDVAKDDNYFASAIRAGDLRAACVKALDIIEELEKKLVEQEYNWKKRTIALINLHALREQNVLPALMELSSENSKLGKELADLRRIKAGVEAWAPLAHDRKTMIDAILAGRGPK